MPIHLSISNLRDLALQEVANNIVFFAVLSSTEEIDLCADPDATTQFQERYLSVLPPNIREDVLQTILNCDAVGAQVRCESLKILLDNSVKSLVIHSFPESQYTQILDVIAEKATSLRYLDLKGLWIKGTDCCKLCKILKGLPNLKVLRIPHVTTDEIMDAISCHNRALQILDVSGESSISKHGIELLCGSNQRLELLDIGRPGGDDRLEPSTVALLLKKLPNLLSVGSYSFVGRALLWIVEEDVDAVHRGGPLELRYLHDTETDGHTLETIALLCPKLKSIYLDRPQKGTVPSLLSLPNLVTLKLSRFDCAELNVLISNCGFRLDILELVVGRGILNVSAIAEFCTQLTSLTLYKVEHLVYFKQVPFRRLKKLDIFYATLSTSCLKYLISAAPCLEHLTLYCNFIVISDELVKSLFADVTCAHLRTIWISNAPSLTMRGVAILLAKCPELTELGYLDSWGLSDEDIDLLRLEIKTRNLDLHLAL